MPLRRAGQGAAEARGGTQDGTDSRARDYHDVLQRPAAQLGNGVPAPAARQSTLWTSRTKMAGGAGDGDGQPTPSVLVLDGEGGGGTVFEIPIQTGVGSVRNNANSMAAAAAGGQSGTESPFAYNPQFSTQKSTDSTTSRTSHV